MQPEQYTWDFSWQQGLENKLPFGNGEGRKEVGRGDTQTERQTTDNCSSTVCVLYTHMFTQGQKWGSCACGGRRLTFGVFFTRCLPYLCIEARSLN